MDETTTIQSLLDDMISADNYDTESAHSKADDILIQLIGLLANYLSDEDKVSIKAIIDHYETMDKWYA